MRWWLRQAGKRRLAVALFGAAWLLLLLNSAPSAPGGLPGAAGLPGKAGERESKPEPAEKLPALSALEEILTNIRLHNPWFRESLHNISKEQLEKEITARLGKKDPPLPALLEEGLNSGDPEDRSIALLAQADWAEAEAKSLEAARVLEIKAPASALRSLRRAGAACMFQENPLRAAEHFRSAVALTGRSDLSGSMAIAQYELARALRGAATDDATGQADYRELMDQSRKTISAAEALAPPASRVRTAALIQQEKARILQELAGKAEGDERARLLQGALAAASLAVEGFDAFTPEWGGARNTLGGVLMLQAQGVEPLKRHALLDEAMSTYLSALVSFGAKSEPARRASIHHNLSVATQRRSIGEAPAKAAELLRDALEGYYASLEFYTREDYPESWAKGQTAAGLTLRMLASIVPGEKKLKLLRHAVTAQRLALEVYTWEKTSAEWISARQGLANALEELGDAGSGEERIRNWKEAEECYSSLLEKLNPSATGEKSRTKLKEGLERLRQKLKP